MDKNSNDTLLVLDDLYYLSSYQYEVYRKEMASTYDSSKIEHYSWMMQGCVCVIDECKKNIGYVITFNDICEMLELLTARFEEYSCSLQIYGFDDINPYVYILDAITNIYDDCILKHEVLKGGYIDYNEL